MKRVLALAVVLLANHMPVTAARGQRRNEIPRWIAELAPAAGDSARIRKDRNFDPAAQSLNAYLDKPTQANYDDFQDKFRRLERSGPGGWQAKLFEVFKESHRLVEKNQMYWLKRREEHHKINDAIQEYMRELVEAANRLNEKVRGASDDKKDKQTVRVTQKEFDLGPPARAVDAEGNLISRPAGKSSKRRLLGRDDLNNLIEDADMMSQRARNEGDKIKGFLDGCNKKSRRINQRLSVVWRRMRDTRGPGLGGTAPDSPPL